MAKVSKKQAKPNHKPGQHGKTVGKRRQHSQILPHKHDQSVKPKSCPAEPKQANQRPKIPYTKRDNVLLIGEGDFSFALSLARHHQPKSLIATCYDSESELVQKYPNVKATISQLLAAPPKSNGAQQDNSPGEEDAFEGFSPPPSPNLEDAQVSQAASSNRKVHVLYGIDATRLNTTHSKALRRLGPFTKIVFNFPHVGGLSTDVNRQVRANQALLVSFFESAKPLLFQGASASASQKNNNASSSHSPPTTKSDRYDTDSDNDSSTTSTTSSTSSNSKPQLLITLFTSAPYTLWNIRDLARHSGLAVTESFRFFGSAYPGYTHARTIGDIIVTGKDRSAEGEGEGEGKGKRRGGAWRGEEREARTYVLALKDEVGAGGGGSGGGRQQQQQPQKRKKRKRGGEESDSD